MANIEVWYTTSTALKRRGRSDVIIGGSDGFVLGVTIPSAAWCGVYPGISRTAYTGPTTFVGTADVNNPLLIESKDISSLLTWGGGYVKFLNCNFTSGGDATFSVGQVTCRGNYLERVTFERCTFRPDVPNYFVDGLIGHHYTAYRCDVSRTVDGFGVYNQYNRRADVYIQGNYVHEQCRFEYDGYPATGHSDGSHNDGIQLQGGEGLWVVGNAFHGYQFHADGSTPAFPWNYTAQGVLTQENVAVGGVYYAGDFHVTNNWFWGFQQVIRPATRSSSMTVYDIEIVNNTQMDMPRNWGGSIYPYYLIRPTANVTVNGIAYSTSTTVPTVDTNNNNFDTGTSVDAAFRGAAYKIWCDATG